MTVLFGHPTGNPNAHHAALAHFEVGHLEAFCVPWMPTDRQLKLLQSVPNLREYVPRLARRRFPQLASAPLAQGRFGEWKRMARRLRRTAGADERISYEANDWLMHKMRQLCRRPPVTAVHAYEDCSLLQFEEAARLGKVRIYDMPIGYYPEWQASLEVLAREYRDWLAPGAEGASRYVRVAQKVREMELADLVLVPSGFVRDTILRCVDKNVAIAGYGVDLDAWRPAAASRLDRELTFLYAGQCTLRKGTPLLLDAWVAAGIADARLRLAGSWQLNDAKLRALPPGVEFLGPVGAADLRYLYQTSDVFVFPSMFEGFGLVILEAMACGLPVIGTDATAATDIVEPEGGWVLPRGDRDALVEVMRWIARHRERLPDMRLAARRRAEQFTWKRYRDCVNRAVAAYV
ncbi:MAG: glycosyltransferase family 4 protein [Burkholderiales bacterium]|nr:glycosyltransferase family 4 protein [Burkholderiales bacterium]